MIVNGRLTHDTDACVLLVDGEAVRLTATETKIVDLFMRNLGRYFQRKRFTGVCVQEDALPLKIPLWFTFAEFGKN